MDNPSDASTSTDNSVTYDGTALSVTINQASGQLDPTAGSTIHYTVVFSKEVTDFTASDVAFGRHGSGQSGGHDYRQRHDLRRGGHRHGQHRQS